ncbi:ABC transporter substrate-binding protein [Parablautia muri]|uniref:Extracellular solute-binding protein n=1 Tax=Parablautia muri TaxID=2320879 RepID=A0A9X5BIG9_9FIRM|nr:extracellular solute-binding protein [Parablautia muri]NBJ94232.1 extracellular solute-binding protein [Parablautia muri]
MLKKGKKMLALGLTGAMVMGLMGCSNSTDNQDAAKVNQEETEDSNEKSDTQDDTKKDVLSDNQDGGAEVENDVTLEVEVGYTAEALEQFREVIDDFTAQTGIEIELVTPGADYETVMKTRMASGDMPDVFVTHGWSIARYKEYLTRLNDETWFEKIDASILPVVSDQEGSIYVLPVTQGMNGLSYNKRVLEDASVNATEIQSMDDFKEACEKLKEKGVTPVHIGGKDSWTTAGLYNVMAPAFYTAKGCKYPSGDTLKDGSFDWDANGKYLLEEIAGMVQAGYFNTDFITADETSSVIALGEGKCAFMFGSVGYVQKAKAVVDDAEIGVIPMPSTMQDGESQYMTGEGSCFGIFKDTEHMEQAKQFLEFLALPDNANKIMKADGEMPALDGMDKEGSESYQAYQESINSFNVCYDNLFDREYFPSGMWSVMTDAVMEVFMDPEEQGIDRAVSLLKENYIDKYEAAQE